MHIPRQSDGSSARPTVHADAAAGLRARRRHLVGQLRSVGYWQRLVQARTDLSVAGLLYTAPVPAAVHASGAWTLGAWSEGSDDQPEQVDPAGLTTPPEGVDVQRLLGGADLEAPGASLDRLRELSLVLVARSRVLQEELDVVTTALHERLALDGADGAEGARDAVGGRVVDSAALA